MKYIFPILLVALMVGFGATLPLISAATDTVDVDDVFQQHLVINYSKPCFYNGTYCSSTATCNYTIYYPNNSIYLDNAQAVNTISKHSYMILFSDLGIYTIDMVCCDGGLGCGSETFYAQITPSGWQGTLGLYIILIILSFGAVIFGIWKQDVWITLLGAFGLYFFGIWTIIYGLDIYKNWVTEGFGIFILAIAFYVSSKTVLELIQREY